MGATTATWQLLGTWGIWEYWLSPDGVNISRRKVSAWNVLACDGAPMGARWESTLVHFETYVAGCLAV